MLRYAEIAAPGLLEGLLMPRLGATVARLTAMRRAAAVAEVPSRLSEMRDFGTNPGALIARTYVPSGLAPGAPCVVVLHGCTQNAALYDRGSGWSALADRHGFAVLFPEQARANNFNLCFNWYGGDDRQRGRGEVASIAQMVRHLTALHRLDPARVFVNGLSAGGAMTAAMLATYPELFAGGAIIAGLPFGIAEGVPEALERMRGKGMPSRGALASRAANASDHRGPWPTLSVWHGTADDIVSSANAGAIVNQWRDRIGLGAVEGTADLVDGQHRTTWRDTAGRAMIERYDIKGMGHGVPLATRGEAACGSAGAHMLEAGICSTRRIAAFWGLTKAEMNSEAKQRATVFTAATLPVAKPTGVGAVIEDALRAAGLMR